MSDLLIYKGYFGSAQYSVADEVFHGKLEGIDDLVTYEATNVQELIQAFNDAVEDYLETCREIGKDPNKTYKGSFNVRIPGEMHRDAAVYAASKDISLNDFVKTAIQYALMNKGDLINAFSLEYSGHSPQAAEEPGIYKLSPKKLKKNASAGKRAAPSRSSKKTKAGRGGGR